MLVRIEDVWKIDVFQIARLRDREVLWCEVRGTKIATGEVLEIEIWYVDVTSVGLRAEVLVPLGLCGLVNTTLLAYQNHFTTHPINVRDSLHLRIRASSRNATLSALTRTPTRLSVR